MNKIQYMSEINYKVGDHVRIKSLDWYKKMLSRPSKLSWINRQNGFFEGIQCGSRVFTDAMCKYCGKVMTIQEVGLTFYLMEEDKIGYEFTDEMIECLVDEPQEEKKIECLADKPQEKMVSLEQVCERLKNTIDDDVLVKCGSVIKCMGVDDFVLYFRKIMEE